MTKLVKLNIYEHQKEQTIINELSAESWDQFLIIRVEGFDNSSFDEIIRMAQKSYPDKKVFLMDKSADISFFGVKEDDE